MSDVEKFSLSLAPMMEVTDRHFRYMIRLMSNRTALYTEMIPASALIYGREDYLAFSASEYPVILQLGGDDPSILGQASRLGEKAGFVEINLNCGCPSPRVKKGNFGASLMADPVHAARIVSAMKNSVGIPVSVKQRIGINGREEYHHLVEFVDRLAEAGCKRFIIHARIAVLEGLDPKENRTVPPLRYEDVFRLKKEFPDLTVEINGGVTNIEHASTLLNNVDGVMIGRAARDNPYIFADVDSIIYRENVQKITRFEVCKAMIEYLHDMKGNERFRPQVVLRHLLNIFHGLPGSRKFRRYMSSHPWTGSSSLSVECAEQVIKKAMECIDPSLESKCSPRPENQTDSFEEIAKEPDIVHVAPSFWIRSDS